METTTGNQELAVKVIYSIIIMKLADLLYPEALEMGSLCSIMNDELSIKMEDFLENKAMKELTTAYDRNEIIATMHSFDFLQVTEDRVYFKIPDNIKIYIIINVPGKLSKENLMQQLGIKSVSRLYKQSLYWTVVSDSDEFNLLFQEALRSATLKDDDNKEIKLKYEINTKKELLQNLNKRIQHFSYLKDSHDLKGSSGKTTITKGSKLSTNSNSSNNDNLKWRKKSECENAVPVTNIISSTTNNKQVTNFCKRERFYSDANEFKKLNNFDLTIKKGTFSSPSDIEKSMVKYSLDSNIYSYITFH